MRKNVLTPAAMIALGLCMALPGTAVGDAAAAPNAAPPIQGTWNCETTQANAWEQQNWPLHATHTIEALSPIWNHGMARPPGSPVSMYVAPSDPTQSAAVPFYDYYLGYGMNGQVYVQMGINPADSSMTYFVATSSAPSGQLNGSQWNIVYPVGQDKGYKFGATFTTTQGQFTISYPDLTQVCTQNLSPTNTHVIGTERALPATSASESLNTTCQVYKTGASYPTTENLRVTTMAKYTNGQAYWWQGVGTEPNPDPATSQPKVIYEFNIFWSHEDRVAIELNDVTGALSIATTKSRNWNDSVWTVVYPKLENGFTFTRITSDPAFPLGDLTKGFELLFKDGYQLCGPAH